MVTHLIFINSHVVSNIVFYFLVRISESLFALLIYRLTRFFIVFIYNNVYSIRATYSLNTFALLIVA